MERGMSRLNDLTEVAPGIFYTRDGVVTADQSMISFLKLAALRTPSRRARLCAHPAPDATQHDMLIVSHCETYVAPHRHFVKSESMLVIEGLADTIIFDDDGNVTQRVPIGPAGSKRAFFFRMPERTFHSLSIETEMLVFVESTKGPFRLEESENASWAPIHTDVAAGRTYIQSLVAPQMARVRGRSALRNQRRQESAERATARRENRAESPSRSDEASVVGDDLVLDVRRKAEQA
jgi:cupin fold WbuC family metalloprotein